MAQLKIGLIDYGAGNLRSVGKALELTGFKVKLTEDYHDLADTDGIVFPGQGVAGPAMGNLDGTGLAIFLKEKVEEGVPFFGVCLGLQLLFDHSDEGNTNCLGILPGNNLKFTDQLKVPHMGWNKVELVKEHPAFKDIPKDFEFYFVHSYYANPSNTDHIVGETSYGIKFPSVVAYNNLIATQFHPEKSSRTGVSLYENFFVSAKEGKLI
jgi:glutamine amidotransferase